MLKSFARIPYCIHTIGFMFGPTLAIIATCIAMWCTLARGHKGSVFISELDSLNYNAITVTLYLIAQCGFTYAILPALWSKFQSNILLAILLAPIWPLLLPFWFVRHGRSRLTAYYRRVYPTYDVPGALFAWVLLGFIGLTVFAFTAEFVSRTLVVSGCSASVALPMIFCLTLLLSRWRGPERGRHLRILVMFEKNMFWGGFLYGLLLAPTYLYALYNEANVVSPWDVLAGLSLILILPTTGVVLVVYLFVLDASILGANRAKRSPEGRRLSQFALACVGVGSDRNESARLPFQVKVCGLTDPRNAAEVEAAGADAVGLNFYPKSKRYVEPEVAKTIVDALSSNVVTIGLFVNEKSEQVLKINRELNLDFVQLHGDETPAYIAGLGTDVRIIRAFRLGKDGLAPSLAYLDRCSELNCLPAAVLLDAYSPDEYGGTGKTTDWDAAAQFPRGKDIPPLILAGGLTPENVANAIATASPDAVDTAGGVESAPGVKDPDLTRRFTEAALDAFGSIALSDSE